MYIVLLLVPTMNTCNWTPPHCISKINVTMKHYKRDSEMRAYLSNVRGGMVAHESCGCVMP